MGAVAGIAEMTKEDAGYEVAHKDPHWRNNGISFYSLVETLIRISYIRIREVAPALPLTLHSSPLRHSSPLCPGAAGEGAR